MATIQEYTPEESKAWEEWKATRPPVVRDLADRFPPNKLFRLKESRHRVHVLSYNEDGTMTVSVSGDFNIVIFSRQVFGIRPEDMEECELPGPDERLGDFCEETGTDPQVMIDAIKEHKKQNRPRSS